MSIAVIGLLPDQIQKAMSWDVTRRLGVHYVPKDRMKSSIDEVVRSNDAVVMMTKFINHNIQDKIPPAKRRFVDGGLTKLRDQLETMLHAQAIAGLPTANTKPTTSVEKREEAVKPAKAVEATLPIIHLRRYEASGRIDWQPLVDLEVGQRAAIPAYWADTTDEVVRKAEQTVGRYGRDYGLIAKVVVADHKVYVERLPYADERKDEVVPPPPVAASEPVGKETTAKTTSPSADISGKKWAGLDHPSIQDVMMPRGSLSREEPWWLKGPSKAPVITHLLTKADREAPYTDGELVFWTQCYVNLLARMDVEEAGRNADKSVIEYRRRALHRS